VSGPTPPQDCATGHRTTSGVFLVPTAAGASYATAWGDDELRRLVLLALLRGGASRPAPFAEIAKFAGLADRKAAAALIFGLQREGWLGGDVEPLVAPRGPMTTLLSRLLGQLGGNDPAVLADSSGLCVAHSGIGREEAETLCAHVASLDPRLRRMAIDQNGWGLAASTAGNRMTVRPLCVGQFRFLLVLGEAARVDSASYIELVSVLARHCLGEFDGANE